MNNTKQARGSTTDRAERKAEALINELIEAEPRLETARAAQRLRRERDTSSFDQALEKLAQSLNTPKK